MNPQKAAIRILVADDHTVVREGLVAILEQEEDLTVVGASASSAAGPCAPSHTPR